MSSINEILRLSESLHKNEPLFNLMLENFFSCLEILMQHEKYGLKWQNLRGAPDIMMKMTSNSELEMKLLKLFSEYLNLSLESYQVNYDHIRMDVKEGKDINSELIATFGVLKRFDGYGVETEKHLKLLQKMLNLWKHCDDWLLASLDLLEGLN